MKLTTHLFALIVVFSVCSLIGCSKDNSPATEAQLAQARAQGVQCGLTPSCGTAFLQANGATPAQIAMAYPNGTLPQNATGLLPPATVTPVTGTATGTAPPVIFKQKDADIRDQAARIQKAMAAASANPSSSYYVDPSAEDIPARPSPEQLAALSAISAAVRSPASATGNSNNTNSTQ